MVLACSHVDIFGGSVVLSEGPRMFTLKASSARSRLGQNLERLYLKGYYLKPYTAQSVKVRSLEIKG